MKKIFLLSFLFLFLGIGQSQAALVTCGPGSVSGRDCEFCDIFVMGSGILEWIFTWVVPTVAALMFIIGGVFFLLAGAKAEMFNKAKNAITAAVIGLLIIFGAWVIVNTVFDKIGVVQLGHGWKWYDIQCAIERATPGAIPAPSSPTPTPTPTPPVPTPAPAPSPKIEELIPPLPPIPPAF